MTYPTYKWRNWSSGKPRNVWGHMHQRKVVGFVSNSTGGWKRRWRIAHHEPETGLFSLPPFFICSQVTPTEVLHISLPELGHRTPPFTQITSFIHRCFPIHVEKSQTAFYFVLCHLRDGLTVGSLIHPFLFIDSTPIDVLFSGQEVPRSETESNAAVTTPTFWEGAADIHVVDT